MSVRDDVRLAVERAAGAAAEHAESVPIVETFRGQTVWEGIVEVFRVALPAPTRAYGWAVESPEGPQFIAVLGTPPIDSPLAAVRAWIVSQVKK